jgi:hypothetical protein
MSRFNYSTERNKPVIEEKEVSIFKLNTGIVKQLYEKRIRFNSWERSFLESIRHNRYKIVSGKQWNKVRQLLKK